MTATVTRFRQAARQMPVGEPVFVDSTDTFGNLRRLRATACHDGTIRYALESDRGIPLALDYLLPPEVAMALPVKARDGWQVQVVDLVLAQPAVTVQAVR